MDECRRGGYRRDRIMAQPVPPQTLTARLKFAVGDLAIDTAIKVPAAPAPPEAVLPTLQKLIDAVVEAAESNERQQGREISCRKGCAACCRQLVPVSRTEARAIRALVARQPAGRRQALQTRFGQAAQRLHDAGLAAALLDPAKRQGRPDREFSLAYFALGIACPFLEDETCSIHPDRPLICREYLVTSPAAACSTPDQSGVTPVAVPKLSLAARGLERDQAGAATVADWVPLALALEPAATGKPPHALPGPDWIKRFFAALAATAPGPKG